MVASDYAMPFLSDIQGAPEDRPQITETTALGTVYLAGLGADVCRDPADLAKSRARNAALRPVWTPPPAMPNTRAGAARCGPPSPFD